MMARRFAPDPRKRWLACQTLLVVLGAGCSSALDNQRPSAPVDAGQKPKPADNQLKLPNEDLAAKHAAAKASPQSFETVLAYAKSVTDFCLASLVDTSCTDCTGNRVRYKPMSDLDVQNWVLVQNALSMLEVFKNGQDLPPAQFEQFVGVKGRLLGLAGHAAQERTLVESYVGAHPDAVPVVRRRLEILREARDVNESELQCRRSRVSMKSASDAARLELLMDCVALHPDNAEGKSDLPEYSKYLPDTSKAEQRLYRRYLVQRCVEKVGSKQERCAQACDCKGKPDRQQRAECKRGCRTCRVETARKIRECKKTGGVPEAAPRPRAAPRARGRSARPKDNAPAPPPGPEPKATVL